MPRLLGQTLQAQISRTYHVSVPDNPLQATVPAIVVFHGGGQDAQTIARRWGLILRTRLSLRRPRWTPRVGVSHRAAIEAMHGIPYERPAAHLREYLAVLVPLLSEGRVDVEGEHYRVHAEITVPGTAPVSVVVGALSPLMAGVAGAGSDGIVTWLAGPRTLEQVLVPAVTAAASGGGRPAPRIVAALPVAVADEAAARATADVTFARYGTLPNYQRVFAREGVTAPGELAVVGDEHAVEQQLRRHAALGATEFWPIAFPVGDDPDASLARTTQLLASLAPEL